MTKNKMMSMINYSLNHIINYGFTVILNGGSLSKELSSQFSPVYQKVSVAQLTLIEVGAIQEEIPIRILTMTYNHMKLILLSSCFVLNFATSHIWSTLND